MYNFLEENLIVEQLNGVWKKLEKNKTRKTKIQKPHENKFEEQ